MQANLLPGNVMLAAFAEILSVWSERPQFTLNLTMASRLPLHPQVGDIVGDFTAITLLEIDNSTPSTFLERARRIQEQLWQDLDHRYFSGLRVMRELIRRQKSSGNALMPIVFTNTLGIERSDYGQSLEEHTSNAVSSLGEDVYTISQTSQVYLDHSLVEWEGRLIFNWDSIADIFPEGLLDDMFDAYQSFLKRLATDETAWTDPYRQLVPLAQLEQRAALNATEAPISDELLHTLFIAQVEAHRDDMAVIGQTHSLTYEELYQQASSIGHWLRERGAKPNTLVAVVMEKGWEQIVAVFGILISGAAYLPVDPTLPTERQHYLLEQGEAKLALTQSHLEDKLTWPKDLQRLSVDTVASSGAASSHRPIAPSEFEPVQSPTDLAYVLYTSGSTGVPKGVALNHQGPLNTILDINRRYEVGHGDRVLALSALNFDLSVYDLFGPLAAGGTIVMPAPDGRRDPSHWATLMAKHGVTLWNSVPALMQMLVEYQAGRALNAPLRLVMMSGDWIPLSLPERIRALWPAARIMSQGGPTETSIWSIYYPIEQVDPTWKSIPYGKPITNQRHYVLNALLEPCPVWVPGALYGGGVGLALGYWRDEERTQASFITHPRTGERWHPKGMIYRTGDLARYLPDGNLEILGREDFQVKIRGHRIELGEIEANLIKHPGVKEALVAAVGEPKGDKQLVAYVVPAVPVDNQPLDQAADGTDSTDSIEATESILSDPGERVAFKLEQRGIRRLDAGRMAFKLPQPTVDEASYLSRQSHRQFLSDPVPLAKFGALLAALKPHTFADSVFPKYRYGSAGGLYPVQTYLYIKPNRVMGLEGGTYYYHPIKHELILLSSAARLEREWHADVNQANFEQSAFSLFLVGELAAIDPMYGNMARDYCLLEAGYMSQLLQEEAPEHEIGLCAIGWLDLAPLHEQFELSDSQHLLHSFIGGVISPEQMHTLAQPSGTSQTLEEDIKAYLAQKLPSYMVPNFYVMLEALPLTANGKVDRKALVKPDLANLARKETIAPHTETQKRLAAIWEKMLGVKQISISDDFFELGGDSLFSIQLIRQLRDDFSVDVPVRTVFESSNVKALAEYIDALRQAQEMLLDEDDDEEYDQEYDEGEL